MAGFPLIRLVVRVRCPGVRSHRAGPEPQRGRDAAEPRQPGVPALLPTAAPRGKAKRPRRALLTRASRSPERWLCDGGSGTHPRGHTAEPTAHGHRSTLFPFTGGLQTRGQTVSDPGGRPHRMAWLGSLSPSAGGTGDLSFRSGAASAGKRSPVTAASAPLCGQRRTLARSWGEPHWWQTDELEEKRFAPPSRAVEGLRFYPSRELIVSPTGPEMKGTVLPTARRAASASRWGQFPFWPPRPHGGAGGRGPRSGSACWGRNPKAWET